MKSKGTNYTLKQKNILTVLGENIKLARLRRKLSIRSMAERAGIATSTLGNIEYGSPSVSLGSYLQVLSVLRLENDLLLIVENDPVGRHIQDAGLISNGQNIMSYFLPKLFKTNDSRSLRF